MQTETSGDVGAAGGKVRESGGVQEASIDAKLVIPIREGGGSIYTVQQRAIEAKVGPAARPKRRKLSGIVSSFVLTTSSLSTLRSRE